MLEDAAGNPAHFSTWLDGFSTVSSHLVSPMAAIAGDARNPETERVLAANVLARYARDDVPQLLEFALRSTPRQFDVIAKTLVDHAADVRPALLQEIEAPIPPTSSEKEKDSLASRKANAILLVRRFGDDRFVWPALEHQPDPRVRSCLVNYFAKSAPPIDWLEPPWRAQTIRGCGKP